MNPLKQALSDGAAHDTHPVNISTPAPIRHPSGTCLTPSRVRLRASPRTWRPTWSTRGIDGRRIVLFLTASLLGVSASLTADRARAGGKASPSEVAAHRQEILNDMLTDEYQPELIAKLRRSCALGQEPASVAESRAQGAYFTPDAADRCVTGLVRTARDGRLSDLYRELLDEMGGDVASYERWPRVIGGVVLKGAATVPIGNKKAIDVTPAFAFDAGFTVAYQEGSAGRTLTPDAAQLRTLAEACLGQHNDAGACFSAGYVYGAQAFRTPAVSNHAGRIAELATASADTRHEVESLSHDLFERKIFDPYLHFSSPEDEAEFRKREAEARKYISDQLARGTPEGNLNASGGIVSYMLDAQTHGASDSPDFNVRWKSLGP